MNIRFRSFLLSSYAGEPGAVERSEKTFSRVSIQIFCFKDHHQFDSAESSYRAYSIVERSAPIPYSWSLPPKPTAIVHRPAPCPEPECKIHWSLSKRFFIA